MVTQLERREATRTKLVEAARKHFVRYGYERTHTQDILTDTGMSRGALYHHFKSKQALFEEVFVRVSDEAIARAIQAPANGDSPLEALVSSCVAWLRAVRRHEIATILLDQGPQVLGWKRARDIEAKTSLGLMKHSLQSAVDAGEVEVPSVDLAARLLNALLAEAALAAAYKEPRVPLATQEAAICQFIEGLRVEMA